MAISPLEMESAIGREMRDKMFAADPTCMHCKKPIGSLEEATAVYFVRRAAWKLTHRAMCALSSILNDTPRFSMNGKAGRSMPGIFRTSSDRELPATPPGFSREQWERHCTDTSEESDGHGDGIAASLHSQQCDDGYPEECPACNPAEVAPHYCVRCHVNPPVPGKMGCAECLADIAAEKAAV